MLAGFSHIKANPYIHTNLSPTSPVSEKRRLHRSKLQTRLGFSAGPVCDQIALLSLVTNKLIRFNETFTGNVFLSAKISDLRPVLCSYTQTFSLVILKCYMVAAAV